MSSINDKSFKDYLNLFKKPLIPPKKAESSATDNQINDSVIHGSSRELVEDIGEISKGATKNLDDLFKGFKGFNDKSFSIKTDKDFGKLTEVAANLFARPLPQIEESKRAFVPARQVCPPPVTAEEHRENFQLFLNKFPQYQLGNDLELLDVSFGSLPKDWKLATVQAKTKEALSLHGLSSMQSGLLKNLTPPIPIRMGLVIEDGMVELANKAMINSAAEHIHSQVPVVTNGRMLKCYPDHIARDLYDCYQMKEGSLCVLMPKGQDPQAFGFNKDLLELWEGDVKDLPDHRLNVADDVERLLLKKSDEGVFHRLVDFCGHGLARTNVCGLPITEFQKTLGVLKESGLCFMSLLSCYAGGTNSASLQTEQGKIPCPIIIDGSFETVSWQGRGLDAPMLLKNAQRKLFSDHSKGVQPKPRSLSPNQMQQLASNLRPEVKKENLPSYIMPRSEILPRTIQTAATHRGIQTTADLAKTVQLRNLEHALEKETDDNIVYLYHSTEHLAFTEPLVPLTVHSIYSIGLTGVRGNAHFYLNRLEIPECELRELSEDTFNAFDETSKEQGQRCFAIGSMQCLIDNQLSEVENCFLVIRPEGAPYGRQMFYRLPGEENYRCITYQYDEKSKSWLEESEGVVSESMAAAEIYSHLWLSRPSERYYEHATAGRYGDKEFMQAFEAAFFGNPLSEATALASEFYQLAVTEPSDPSYHQLISNISRQYMDWVLDTDDNIEIQKRAKSLGHLSNAILGSISEREEIQPLIAELQALQQKETYPFIRAREGNVEALKKSVEDTLNALSITDKQGMTLVGVAIKNGHPDAALMLMRMKAPGLFGAESFDFVSYDGLNALKEAVEAEQWGVVDFLLEKGAGDKLQDREKKLWMPIIEGLENHPKRAEWLAKTPLHRGFKPLFLL